jgi:ribosomal protein L34E
MAKEMNKKCSLCDGEIQDENYSRYRIRLADESDTEPDRLYEDQVCARCWKPSLRLSHSLMNE